MAMQMDEDAFDTLVGEALDDIPDDLAEMFDNVMIVVEDEAPSDDPDLLGLYEGIPITERDGSYVGVLPDRIRIFRLPILDICDSEDDVIDEVYVTVVHELAHHMGISDERLDELGWA